VTDVATRTPSPRWVEERTWRRLEQRVHAGLRRASGTGATTLVSVAAQCAAIDDPTALVVRSRRADDAWFCLEQPDRGGSAIAALGCARALEARGDDRFKAVAARWRAVARDALADSPEGPPGSGLAAVGGFAFAPEGGGSRRWAGFAPASMIVPELSFARRDNDTWLAVNIEIALPLLDPAPTGSYEVTSPMPPSHYEEAVARAVQRIRGGELEKLVLAREVEVNAPAPHDPGAVLGVLREAFPSCYVFAVGRGGSTFLAASPELLVRREGSRASTVALAGSARRSADPAVDDHLGEQLLHSAKDLEENAIVARRIARALKPHAVWVTAAPEPALVRVANIQHLAAPIRAQLASPLGAIELAKELHPTPAVGGEPFERAASMIPALEGLDRGWYAGPVGWTDSVGDGEFCVALRCALLRDRLATLYSGCGIVRDSDPAAELAESEVKLGALLPVLSG
jgi:isochorismate synthase